MKESQCPKPKSHPPSLKAKVAVEAIKAHKTAAQIAQIFGVHPTQVGGWKKQALAGLPDIFGNGREQMRQQSDTEKDELYKQIGQLKVELDFLKKRAGLGSGNAYVTGIASSPNFPIVNPLQASNGGGNDAFVTKINAAGSALVYSSFLGGSADDQGNGIAVDSLGNAYVTGLTNSTDFPTANPLQARYGGGSGFFGDAGDAFVTKINAAGSALAYSTYLGGNVTDQGNGIAVNGAGNAYVTGYTNSTNFPTANPLQAGNAGVADAFILSISGSGCSYTVNPTSLQVNASGGNFPVSIQTDASCSWSNTGLPSWITIPGGTSGTGPATVTLVVAANLGTARSATLSIAGVSITVNQSASTSGCTYAISPGGQPFTAAGGSGSFTVTAASTCSWTAVSTVTWITGAGSGTGNGTVTYQLAANPGAARSGSITIGGLSFTVEQAALTFSFTTASMPHLAVAGSWTTTITLVNTGSTVAQTRLNFFDDNGNPLTLPLTFPQSSPGSGPLLASTLDRTLSPGAILVIKSTGPDAVPIVGWAQLLANGSVGGDAIFDSNTGTTDQQAGVSFENRNANAYIFPFDNTGTSVTGVALANTSAQAGNVGITIRDDTGALVFSSTIALAAQAHTSFVLSNSYGFTAGMRGTVEFDAPSGGQISTLGLLFNNVTHAFGNIPVLTK